MRLSEAAKVSSAFRRHRKAVTLANTIERRLEYYRRRHLQLLSPNIEADAEAAIAVLREQAPMWLRGNLNSSLSSRVMIEQSTTETLTKLFRHLPAPGAAQLTDLEAACVDYMTTMGRDIRATNYRTQCLYEIAYRARENWFMIFNTLTVTDDKLHLVFAPGSNKFRQYINAVDLAVRSHKTEDCHTYFAVVEAGSKSGRLHLHVLHAIKRLPERARDPNTGLRTPYRRELSCFKTFWPHGNSSPKMVRYNPRDAFGRIGYRWPFDTKKGCDLAIKSPLAIAGYVSKYIAKSATNRQRSEYLWRVRKSHNLGLPILDKLASLLHPKHLLTLSNLQSFPTTLNNRRPPAPMMRLAILRRYYTTNRDDFLRNTATLSPRLSPLQSLRASIQNGMNRNPAKCTLSGTNEQKPGDLSEAIADLQQAAAKIDAFYFSNVQTRSGRGVSILNAMAKGDIT